MNEAPDNVVVDPTWYVKQESRQGGWLGARSVFSPPRRWQVIRTDICPASACA